MAESGTFLGVQSKVKKRECVSLEQSDGSFFCNTDFHIDGQQKNIITYRDESRLLIGRDWDFLGGSDFCIDGKPENIITYRDKPAC